MRFLHFTTKESLIVFKLFILSFFIFFASFSKGVAQNLKSTGTNFWLGYMKNKQNRPNHYTRLHISSKQNTSGQVEVPQAGWSTTFSVSANSSTTVTIPYDTVEVLSSETIEGMGIHVTSNDPILVSAINEAKRSTDATSILPKNMLGQSYRIVSWPGNQPEKSEFLVVSAYDNTIVEITPSVQTEQGKPAGQPFTVTLDQGEVYQIQDQGNLDLSGSTVEVLDTTNSCKSVAVFSGNQFVGGSQGCAAADHKWHQSYPLNRWKKKYPVVTYLDKTDAILRVLADKNNTIVQFNGIQQTNLQAGQIYDTVISDPIVVTSNKPVSVTQHSVGGDCDGGTGDPTMLKLNATNQTIDSVDYNLFTTSQIDQYYTHIIVETPFVNQVKLDGSSISGAFSQFPSNPSYSYAKFSLNQGHHQITSDSGVLAYAYGFGYIEAYSWRIGTSFELTQGTTNGDYRDTTFCINDSIQLAPIHSGYDYLWSPSHVLNDSTSQNPVAFPADTTLFQVDIQQSCQIITDSIEVYPQPSPDVEITSATDSICSGDTAYLSASGGNQFSWSNGDSSSNIAVSPQNSELYTVEGFNQFGCSSQDSSQVIVSDLHGAYAKGDTTICKDDSTSLQALGGLQYQWLPSISLSDTGSSKPTAFPDSNQTYYVTIKNKQGCTAYDTVDINVNDPPSITLDKNRSICQGDSLQLSPNLSDADSIQWSPTNGISDPYVANPIISPQDSTTYYLSGYNACGQDLDSFTIHVNPLPTISINGTDTVCNGQDVLLTANSNGKIKWSTGQKDDSITISSIQQDTFITAQAVTDSGCYANEQFQVNSQKPPKLGFSGDTTICEGVSITVNSTSDAFNDWSTGDQGQSITFTPFSDTSIYLINNSTICQNFGDTVQVLVDSVPTVDGKPDTIVEKSSSVKLRVSQGTPSYWQTLSGNEVSCNRCGQPIVDVEEETAIEVTKNNNECLAKDTITIQIKERNCDNIVGVPTAFTPNDDGDNDYFRILGNSKDVEVKELFVYNRWGNKVYDYHVDGPKWDGNHNQRKQENEVYAYHFVYKCDDKVIKETGNVTLIK